MLPEKPQTFAKRVSLAWFLMRRFGMSARAAVTIEWVALAAGVVIAAIAISFIVMNNLADVAKNGIIPIFPQPPKP